MSWVLQGRLIALHSVDRLWPRYKRILYVGANTLRKPQLVDELVADNNRITLLEIEPHNTEWAEGEFAERICRDIRTATFESKSFDYAIWWHGPEHVLAGEADACIASLEQWARACVILAVPYGLNKQDDLGPFEIHHTTWTANSFKPFGYETLVLGKEGVSGSSIIAYRFL